MTSETLHPAPAERLPRPVVRWRALQLALLLGGLAGLGLLCGGQAHADDVPGRVSSAAASRHSVLRAVVDDPVARDVHAVHDRVSGAARTRIAEPAREAQETRETQQAREAATRPELGTVHQVTGPVGELTAPISELAGPVRELTETVGGLTGHVIGGLTTAPPRRPLPDGPPALPGVPGLPVLPGHLTPAPAPSTPSAPSAPADPTAPAGPSAPAAGQPAHTSASGHEKHRARTSAAHTARVAGPTAYDSTEFDGVHQDGAHHAPVARHTVAPRPAAPGTPPRPDGVLGANASAGDGNSKPHSDLHAAASGSRVPVLLLPGAFAPGLPAPVADRHRGIPEFPG